MTEHAQNQTGREPELAEQVALVTGSSRGIGAAIAIELAQRGAAVPVHGRDPATATHVAAAIADRGGSALPGTGDVTRPDDLEAIRAQIGQALGPMAILIADAGASLTQPGPLEEISEQSWRHTIDANLLATFSS